MLRGNVDNITNEIVHNIKANESTSKGRLKTLSESFLSLNKEKENKISDFLDRFTTTLGLERFREKLEEIGIITATNSSVTNINSNATYSENVYRGPYSLEYYDKMKTAQKLGEVVANRGPYVVHSGKVGYCGAGVRGILTSYMGFTGLPSSGANGERWDTILEKSNVKRNGKVVEFRKEKVKTPYDAKPGAIIPYEADAIMGTSARKKHGHVEIRDKNGNFVFDTKSTKPGGSAKVSYAAAQKMTAEEYRKKTGFQGYVYYPVMEGELEQAA